MGYGSWMCLVGAAWFMLAAVGFSSQGVRDQSHQHQHWIDAMLGLVCGTVLLLNRAREPARQPIGRTGLNTTRRPRGAQMVQQSCRNLRKANPAAGDRAT